MEIRSIMASLGWYFRKSSIVAQVFRVAEGLRRQQTHRQRGRRLLHGQRQLFVNVQRLPPVFLADVLAHLRELAEVRDEVFFRSGEFIDAGASLLMGERQKRPSEILRIQFAGEEDVAIGRNDLTLLCPAEHPVVIVRERRSY